MFLTAVPTTPQTFTIDDAYALKSAFVDATDALKEAKAALERAEQAAKRAGGYNSFRLERADERDVVAAFWTAFLHSLPVRQVMSDEDQRDMDKWVESHEYRMMGQYPRNFPAFTVENMLKIAKRYEPQRDFYLRRWALAVYRYFVGYPETPHEVTVPKKLILDGYLSRDGVRYGWQSRQTSSLDRLFHYLDGRPLGEKSNHYDFPLLAAIREAESRGANQGETEYFKFRLYSGNGNLHLTFKRRDLVAKWESLARQGMIERMNN